MVEKINSPEIPSVKREVHGLHNSEMIVSPQQAKGGVGLRLGTKDGPVFGIYSTDELPRDAYGYRVFDGTRIGPGTPFLLVAYPRDLSSGAHAGFEELEIGKGVTLGRRERLTEKNFPNSPIHSSEYVSKSHAGIKVKGDRSIIVTDHSLNGTEVDVAAKVDEGPVGPWESLAQWPEAPKAAPGEFIDSTPWSASVALPEAVPNNIEVVGTQVDETAARAALLDRMTQGLTEGDKKVLTWIAFEAKEKRDAQRSDDGERSRSCSQQIGVLLNRAQNKEKVEGVMRQYASVMHGGDNVAF